MYRHNAPSESNKGTLDIRFCESSCQFTIVVARPKRQLWYNKYGKEIVVVNEYQKIYNMVDDYYNQSNNHSPTLKRGYCNGSLTGALKSRYFVAKLCDGFKEKGEHYG